MNAVHDFQSAYQQTEHTNAQAGPSSYHEIPVVYLPPQGFRNRATQLSSLKSTQDLISRFQLLPTYDKYVKPHVTPPYGADATSFSKPPPTPVALESNASQSTMTGLPGCKGKEKESDLGIPNTPDGNVAGVGGADEDEDDGGDKGSKKRKNNYKHLIKGVPGKHSLKKDDYLQQLMLIPPKQKITIAKFDNKTQREAFTVSLEGLKGWNINALVTESFQAREDRKRRKEMKKLAKTQSMAASAAHSPGVPPSTSVSTPTASTFTGGAPILSATPFGHSNTTATPFSQSGATQNNGTRTPGQGPGFPKVRTPNTGALPSTPRFGGAPSMIAAGQKRSGMPGESARPAKKAKMESGPHDGLGPFERGYEFLQQPTPHDS